MADSEAPNQRDLPVSVLLVLVAGSFLGVGTDSLMKGDIERVVVSYLVGTAFFALGVSWHWLKRFFGPRFVRIVNEVASDFRWWLAVLGIVFLYLGYPTFVDGLKIQATQPGKASAPKPVEKPHSASNAPAEQAKTADTKETLSSPTSLRLSFDAAGNPKEEFSSNVRWAWWYPLEKEKFAFQADQVDPKSEFGKYLSGIPYSTEHSTFLLFLSFDRPLDYDDFRITSSTGLTIPKWDMYNNNSRIAVIWIHGTMSSGSIRIEPVKVQPAK